MSPVSAQVNVWTYHYDNARDGANTNETTLNLTNVSSTTFGKLFSYSVDGNVYAEPLYMPNLTVNGQAHNVLFIATEHNTVYAFDANSAGALGGLLWKTNLGASAVTTTGAFTNKNFGTRYNGNAYTDIEPEVGITGTPVIDTNSGTLYVVAFTAAVSGGKTNYTSTIHALNITNGQEEPYSPVVITAKVAGTGVDSSGGFVTFNPAQENERAALTLAGGIVYVAYAGYADTDPYHGWIIGYNETNLQQVPNYVFNTCPNATTAVFGTDAGESGIWMAGGGLGVDSQTNLYLMLANGSFSATNGSSGVDYGDCFLKISTTNGLKVVDYFAPWDQLTWQDNDTDLGSGGLVLLPDQSGKYAHELLGAGKAGEIFILNRDQFTTNNTHFNATLHYDYVAQTNISQIGASFDTPVYFNNRIYYAASGDDLKTIQVTNGALKDSAVVTNRNRSYSFPGATPVLSANGTNSAIVWTMQMANPAVLVACNATNLADLYLSSTVASRDQLSRGVKFTLPTVADGEVFTGNSNSVSVFGLLAGTYSFSSPTYSIQESNTSATITVNRIGGTNGAAQVSYTTVSGGTATNGVSYTSVSGVLNWTNGETVSKTFTVPILSDGLAEANPTINLALSSPTNPASALGLQSTAVLTIIKPPISSWRLNYFGANANNPAIGGNTADPTGDGIVNLLAYAYALNPTVVNTNPFTWSSSNQEFLLEFPRNTSSSDLTYIIQSSFDLYDWSNILIYTTPGGWVTNQSGASVSESPTNGTVPNQFVNVTVTATTNAAAGDTNQFLRLEVNP
ncbi:MAG TPA: Calx-beta domain-containing protein [Verrucomicrobiae bacterium]